MPSCPVDPDNGHSPIRYAVSSSDLAELGRQRVTHPYSQSQGSRDLKANSSSQLPLPPSIRDRKNVRIRTGGSGSLSEPEPPPRDAGI